MQREIPSAEDQGLNQGPVVMESNRTLQVNWGTINVPTILSVLALLWYTATHSERQDSRLDAIEMAGKRVDALEATVAKQSNLEYRITTTEANVVATNSRIDRQSDALQGIRDTLGTLSANVLVINNKIDSALPIKKSELDPVPPELARRN